MKLIYTDEELPQRSEEWLNVRQKTIGGSEVAAMLDLIPKFDSPKKLWARKTGKVPPKKANKAMMRGTELEPQALELIKQELHYNKPLIDQYFVIHPDFDYVSVSFDGVDLKNKYIVEIKSPFSAWNFKHVVEKGIQDYYFPQVQWQLEVASKTWGISDAYFCSYYPEGAYVTNFETYKDELHTLAMIKLKHDPEYCAAMLEVSAQFKDFLEYDYWDEDKYAAVLRKFNDKTNSRL